MRIASLGVKLALLLLIGVVLAESGLVRGETSDLVVTIKADKEAYGWGEVVGITVSVKNNGASTLSFVWPDVHQAGFEVRKAVHGPTWTLKLVYTTADDIYLQMATYLTLAPGETKTYRFGWDQTSETDVEILPATYWIGGYFRQPYPYSTWSQPDIFEIRGYGYREN